MKSREQFDEWFYEYTGCDPKDSRYVNMVEMYWMAWQASRTAIEVATPWLCGDGDNDTEWTQGYNDGVMATEKAIISAGLKVKNDYPIKRHYESRHHSA